MRPYTSPMRRHVFEVPGISCGHCKQAIESEVADVPGVARVAVDVERKLVEVEGSAGQPEVVAAIVEAGYEVVSDPR
jgi:copper chaperone